MWIFIGPGTEPLSPPLAGRFLTTGPPEKSLSYSFNGRPDSSSQATSPILELKLEIILSSFSVSNFSHVSCSVLLTGFKWLILNQQKDEQEVKASAPEQFSWILHLFSY